MCTILFCSHRSQLWFVFRLIRLVSQCCGVAQGFKWKLNRTKQWNSVRLCFPQSCSNYTSTFQGSVVKWNNWGRWQLLSLQVLHIHFDLSYHEEIYNCIIMPATRGNIVILTPTHFPLGLRLGPALTHWVCLLCLLVGGWSQPVHNLFIFSLRNLSLHRCPPGCASVCLCLYIIQQLTLFFFFQSGFNKAFSISTVHFCIFVRAVCEYWIVIQK